MNVRIDDLGTPMDNLETCIDHLGATLAARIAALGAPWKSRAVVLTRQLY